MSDDPAADDAPATDDFTVATEGGPDGTETNEAGDAGKLDGLLEGAGVSRRRYLSASAAVGAAVLGASGSASAATTDVDILNFALTLEYLEAEFYKEGLDNIGEGGLNRALRGNVGGKARDRVFSELRTIQDQEEQHVTFLENALGSDAIAEPQFNFGTATQDPTEFLQTAALLETTGVAAYAGAAPLIDNADLLPPALGIHSVEARHTSYLNVLNGETGFPKVIDDPLTMQEVLDRAGGFIQ